MYKKAGNTHSGAACLNPAAPHIAHTPNATTEAKSDSFAKDAEAEKSVLGSQNERVPKRTPCPRFSPISVCTMILYRFSLSSAAGDRGQRARSKPNTDTGQMQNTHSPRHQARAEPTHP